MNAFQTAVSLLRNLLINDSGQDLVEYSLVFAMIALGSVTGMGSLASGLNDIFSTVSSTLATNV
jgi:pilus assembly protein Flp/PilA